MITVPSSISEQYSIADISLFAYSIDPHAMGNLPSMRGYAGTRPSTPWATWRP
jgi:hypothetical protein